MILPLLVELSESFEVTYLIALVSDGIILLDDSEDVQDLQPKATLSSSTSVSPASSSICCLPPLLRPNSMDDP